MTYRRRDFGWLREDGEVFLERGAPMSDTGNPAWLIWVKAAEGQFERDADDTRAWSSRTAQPLRALSELTGSGSDGADWFDHVGDEGWLADAKIAADEHLVRRDA